MHALRQRLFGTPAPGAAAAAVDLLQSTVPTASPRDGERFTLVSSGGVAIVATAFQPACLAQQDGPQQPSQLPHTAIVIAPATGVPQGLYRAFAVWLVGQGVAAYTFDFRGVAASRPVRLRGFQAGFVDWSEDINTVLAHVLGQHAQVSLIGHSMGGLLAPVAEHANALHRLVLVGAQTALWRDWPLRQRLPMAMLWHALMPAATALVGYFPGRVLRLGEDLPRGVALQWASRPWRDPFDHPSVAVIRERYARRLPPVHLVAASDDAFATTPAQDRVAQRLLQTLVSRHVWQPQALGLARLGHFDAFRRHAAALWPQLLGWATEGSLHPRANLLSQPPLSNSTHL